jgi:predicted AAA+ superfamily ATPase
MIRILGPRRSGKTTKLLNIAAENGYVLVEPNMRMADFVRHMAVENGLNVNVISAHEMLYCQHSALREKYLIDELELTLSSLGVEGYSDS